MKAKFAATLMVGLALGSAAALAGTSPHGSQHHSPAAHGTAALSFDAQGRRWATDEPLRRHMEEIRAALAGHANAILARELTPAQARDLGLQIEARVAAMLIECRLPPEADANLHLVVADLVEAADILQGRQRQDPGRGAAKAVRATQMYATYFDHPGWRPIYGRYPTGDRTTAQFRGPTW